MASRVRRVTVAAVVGSVILAGGAALPASALEGHPGLTVAKASEPHGVAVDAAGDVFVSDPDNNQVQEWAPGATTGVTVAGGNGAGSAANQLYLPCGVAVDAVGDLFIADTGNDRVQEWVRGATTGVTVAGGNGAGSAADQFDEPVGVAVDSAGDVYVADELNSRVQEWAPGASAGVTVAGGSGRGSAANQLNQAEGVALDTVGNIYVADTGNDRVQKWAPGATAGATVAGAANFPGPEAYELDVPIGVAVDPVGNVYVADTENSRVQEWGPGAIYGDTIAGGVSASAGADGLDHPTAVAVDRGGNVFVADTNNDRVQAWAGFAPSVFVSSSGTPTVFGQPVTFTAESTPTALDGRVAFYADSSPTPISGCANAAVSLLRYQATCTTGSLSAGTHSITARYSGAGIYPAASGTLPGGQQVNQATQAISFPALPGRSVVESPFMLTGITGGASGNPVTFTATGPCTVSGRTVKLTRIGTCAVTAHQAASVNYSAAPTVTRTFTITAKPVITIHGASTAEGNSGTHPLAFTVTLNKPVTVPVRMHWATVNGSATAPSDFIAGSGTLTFTPGRTHASITVRIKGDRVKEPDETFHIRLTHPHNAAVGTPEATGRILNDD
jgi:hypothetical protein